MIWRLSPGSVTEHEPSSLISAASNRSFLSKATHTPEVLTVRSPARRACKARQDSGRISTLHSSWLCTLLRPVTGSVTSRFVAFGLEFVCIFIVQGETRETSNADDDDLQHADETIREEFFRSTKTYDIFRGSMPSFFIRVIKVVRFRPRRAAAPFGPPTSPLDSFRIRIILSCSSELPAREGIELAPLPASSGTTIANVLLRVRITARSTRF
jgi:hypothetical protein